MRRVPPLKATGIGRLRPTVTTPPSASQASNRPEFLEHWLPIVGGYVVGVIVERELARPACKIGCPGVCGQVGVGYSRDVRYCEERAAAVIPPSLAFNDPASTAKFGHRCEVGDDDWPTAGL